MCAYSPPLQGFFLGMAVLGAVSFALTVALLLAHRRNRPEPPIKLMRYERDADTQIVTHPAPEGSGPEDWDEQLLSDGTRVFWPPIQHDTTTFRVGRDLFNPPDR